MFCSDCLTFGLKLSSLMNYSDVYFAIFLLCRIGLLKVPKGNSKDTRKEVNVQVNAQVHVQS